MSPPDKPGIPGRWRNPGLVEDVVTATAPHTPVPAPRERQPSRSEAVQVESADDGPSVVEFQRAVHAQYGSASFHGPAWVLILVLIVGALGVIIYLLATRSAVAVDCASKESVIALDGKIEQLNTRFTALTEKVIADSERQHNDLVDLKLKVIEQSRAK